MANKTAEAAKDRAQKARDRESRERIATFEQREAMEREKLKGLQNVANTIIGSAAKGIFKGSVANDPRWYKNIIPDLDHFTNLPTYAKTGAQEEFNVWKSVPGILVMSYVPSIGDMGEDNSATEQSQAPINFALDMFMTQMRKLNSRVGEYDPAEIGLFLLCQSDLAADIQSFVTALRAALTYDGMNAYVGDGIIKAKGFIPSDIRSNRATYVQDLILLMEKFNANAVIPSGFSYCERALWLESVVMRDSTNPKGQLYVPTKLIGFKYNAEENKTDIDIEYMTSDGGGIPNNFVPYKNTGNTFLSRLYARYFAMFDDQSVITMISDMRSAFGDKIYRFSYDDINKPLNIEPHDEVLSQFQNLTALSVAFGSVDYTPTNISFVVEVDKTTGLLTQGRSVSYNAALDKDPRPGIKLYVTSNATSGKEIAEFIKPLNYYHNSITGDDILVGTRFKMVREYYQDVYGSGSSAVSLFRYRARYHGTEVIMCLNYITFDYVDGIAADRGMSIYGTPETFANWMADATIQKGNFERLCALSYFDWAPLVVFGTTNGKEGQVATPNIFGDLCNYFYISKTNLRKISHICVASEFFVKSDDFKR